MNPVAVKKNILRLNPFNRGKILKIKTGFNPNSSSIGTNLTPLIIGASIVALFIPVISIIVSKKLKNKSDKSIDSDQDLKE